MRRLEKKEKMGKWIIERLYDDGMIKTWYKDKPEGWFLTSGLWSPFYIQLRSVGSYENSSVLLGEIGKTMGTMIKEECPEVNKIVGVAAAGIPLATAITMKSNIPMCYTRNLEGVKTIEQFEGSMKKHGEPGLIEGMLNDGDTLAIVDDLVTRFDSKMIALKQIEYEAKKRNVSVSCKDVVVLFDREQGAEKRAIEYGMRLHSVIPFKTKGIDWLRMEMIEKEYDVIKDYLEDDKKYQDKKLQRELIGMAQKV